MKTRFFAATALALALNTGSAAAQDNTPTGEVLEGRCLHTRQSSVQQLEAEQLPPATPDGPSLTRIWFGQHGWTHMFSHQVKPRERHPDVNNVIRIALPQQGITLEYDLNARLGHGTMTTADFNRHFRDHESGNRYQDVWACRFMPARDPRMVPSARQP